ncbi:hypothetical protein ABW02_20280 [Niallia circulans]|uniref:Uncharacterized protein n=1 Tax=Niallia circulans TaxID=1397 RepID=A0A0J1IAS0_NIACI|nr:hypothetical protein [Niallia circulans]KLV23067.1 hypothetical protein ABW02_20280 [Niallia circulans]
MLWFGLKRKLNALEKQMSNICVKVEKNESFEQEIQRILLIGEDEEMIELVDQFSELNHSSLNSYYDMHKVLDKLDEETLVGSIARLKGIEEVLNSAIHITPSVTVLTLFISAYVALSQTDESLFLGYIAVFISAGFVSIIFNWSRRNRKGRKRAVYFRSLLEHRLEKFKNNNLVDEE